MAAQTGRAIQIRADIAADDNFVSIGGMRSKSITMNEEEVDVSDSDSTDRFRELLAGAGIRTVGISGSGVFKDSSSEQQLMTWFLAGTHGEYEFFIPDFGTLKGFFQISSLEYSGEYNGEAQFSVTFANAGDVNFTAA